MKAQTMTTEYAASTTRPNRNGAILYGGLIAGALDLAAAIISNAIRGIEPVRIMQSISSGLMGSSAYEQGAASVSLGVVLHFLMMWIICAIYYAASRRLPVLTARPLVMGVLYGIVVYLVMNFVVLPLSAFPHQLAFTPSAVAVGLGVMIFCVGLPISLAVRRFG
jgi:uncharacterized membrane protein YagU involved in acid resistance